MTNGKWSHLVLVGGFTPAGFVVLDSAWPHYGEPQTLTYGELNDYGVDRLHISSATFVLD